MRLYKDFLGLSLLFCNPDQPEGWVQIGPILPCTEPAERQHFRLYKAKHGQAFRSLYQTFNWLWDHSLPTILAEDVSEGFSDAMRKIEGGNN